MNARRSRRLESVPSPRTLLSEAEPARNAINKAMRHVTIGGPIWAALEAAGTALDRLADALGHPGRFAAMDHINAWRHTSPILSPAPERPTMPSMPDPETYEIAQDDDGSYAVTYARTGTVVVLNGTPQRGLCLEDADDVADHLEAIDRISAARGTGTMNA